MDANIEGEAAFKTSFQVSEEEENDVAHLLMCLKHEPFKESVHTAPLQSDLQSYDKSELFNNYTTWITSPWQPP